MKLRLNLKEKDEDARKERVKQAETNKKSATETLEEAFDRVWESSKWTDDKHKRLYMLAKESFFSGMIGRMNEGKLTKGEVLSMGAEVERVQKEALREQRIQETLRTKPENYHVITDDSQLNTMIDRLRQEVSLQQSDEWFKKIFNLFNNTHIREVLASKDIEIPLVKSFTIWDTETSGTDTRIDMTGGYSFWLPILNEGYYVAYGHLTDDEQCTRSKTLAVVKRFVESESHIKGFHNTPFDYAMFLNDGLSPKGFRYDSLDAMKNLADGVEESYGLKELVTKYKKHIGADHLDDFTFEDLFGRGSPMIYSPEVVGIYAIKDVEKGWLLAKWQIEMMLKIDDLYYPYFQIRQYLYEVNTTIERTGFEIDIEEMKRLEVEFSEKLDQSVKDLYTAYNINDDFLYEMSMHLKGDKIKEWISKQRGRIAKQDEMLSRCKQELKDANPTTKKYQQLKERIYKYENNPLPKPVPQNSPDFITEFNLGSDQHIQYLVYDVLKIEDKTKLFDKSKVRAVNKDVLALYFKEEESLKPLAEYSKFSTLLGTFVEKIPKALDVDGRIHTQLKTVSTGRYGSSGYSGKDNSLYRSDINDSNYLEQMRKLVEADKKTRKGTNLQNIPARSEEGQRVRMAFVPPKGRIFGGSDLSSIEPRIQAHRMTTEFNDDKFAEMYRRGLDPYVEFAAILFEVPTGYCLESYYKQVKGTDEEVLPYRKIMKQLFLAIGYGQAFDMFYQGIIQYGINEEHALRAYNKFDEILPGFRKMVESTFEHLREKGWTATIFKQKRRFPGYVQKYKRLCQLMKKAGIENKNDPDLAKKSKKLPWELRSEFWDLIRFTGGCERSAFNHTIQGSGANILQLCMIRAYYECVIKRGWEFSLTLHDEQKMAIPVEQLTPETIELYDDIMTKTVTLETPLACDTVIEPRWMEEYGPGEWDFENNKPKGSD